MTTTTIQDLVSAASVEFYHSWAAAHPELFVASVKRFQDEHPITHWSHRVDLSLSGQVKLLAYRRPEPFEDVQAYLAERSGNLYLSEIGMGR